MSFSNDCLADGDRATYMDMLSDLQTQSTDLAYPDPTNLITQPLLYHEVPLPGTIDPYPQPWAADVNDMQVEDHILPNFMQYPGALSRTSGGMPEYCGPYQMQPMSQASGEMSGYCSLNQSQTTLHTQEPMTAYHSPYQIHLVSPTLEQMPDYCSQHETQTWLQGQEQMAAYHSPYETQLMSQTLEQTLEHHSPYQTQPTSRAPARMPDYRSPYQRDPPITDPGINHQLPSPTSLSPEDSTTFQGARSHQKCRKTMSPSTENDEEYLQSGNKSVPSKKRNRRKRNTATLSSHAPAQSLQQPDLGKRSRAASGQKLSKLGQLKAKLGDTMGSDHRAREKVLWENGTMLGWVNNEWKPAVYHADVREKLILLDAQQPGAPVWERGMSLNYTSYSPVTQDWTSDPASIRDLKGRQVCLMRRPPADWTHNPKTGFLTHEGLFILDENNRPIKDFPGAPLALSNKAPAHLLEGLRRTFGMTIPDASARMPIRDTRLGPKRVQSNTTFTNRVMLWKNKVNKGGREIMFPWLDRTKNKAAKESANTSSGPQNDDEEEADSISDLAPTSSMDMNETYRSNDDHLYPSMQEASAAMTAPNGFIQHQTWHAGPLQ